MYSIKSHGQKFSKNVNNSFMRTIFILLGLAVLAGCADSGYQPSYIISHTEEKALAEPKAPLP